MKTEIIQKKTHSLFRLLCWINVQLRFWLAVVCYITCGSSYGAIQVTENFPFSEPRCAETSPVSDQSYTGSINLESVLADGFAFAGQTVTAGKSGELHAVELWAIRRPDFLIPWICDIQEVVDGRPTGLVLSTARIQSDQFPSAWTNVPFRVIFEHPAYFNAGEQYAIVLHPEGLIGSPGQSAGKWAGRFPGGYHAGNRVHGHDASSLEAGENDLFFQTLVRDCGPEIRITDVSVVEGNAGGTVAAFSVSLSRTSDRVVEIGYVTTDGTAKASERDYVPTAGSLLFQPGEVTKIISVTINGDTWLEADEAFFVRLNSSYGTVARATATCTVLNDDLNATVAEVVNVLRLLPVPAVTAESVVRYRVLFSESVSGISPADFTPIRVTGDLSDVTVISVSAVNGIEVDVTVSTGTGDGALRLDVIAGTAGFTDDRGSRLQTSFREGEVFTIDRTAPQIESITRLTPTNKITSVGAVTYRVRFSEDVNGVVRDNFVPIVVTGGLSDPRAAYINRSVGREIDVVVHPGIGDGELRLDALARSATMRDDAGNALSRDFTSGEAYTVIREYARNFTVVSPADAGPGTLRQAIVDSNVSPGHDVITFDIPIHLLAPIRLLTDLPKIIDTLTIEGYSQPTSRPNSLAAGNNAEVHIHIQGSGKFGSWGLTPWEGGGLHHLRSDDIGLHYRRECLAAGSKSLG